MDLKTLEDYQKAARSWVEHVIPSDATFIKKLCCISTQSLNVFRDLLWLTRKEPLKPDFDEGYLACPVDLWRPVLNEYYPHDLWLYSVLRAVKILSFWKPIFDNAGSDLESSHQNDLGLYEIWPKMTDATTAFNGAGFSTAEAIINGLWRFLLNTVECFCSRDRDMPDIFLVSENVMGYRNDQKNMEIWPNQHPAIKLWKDATLKEAKEYFPLAKWPLADLDGEYSRVSILLDHEATLAQTEQEANALTKDEMITITEAAKLLGINAGTVSRWTTDGIIKNNGEAKRKRRLSKISVLLLKDKREREDRLKDAADVLQDMEHKIPDWH